MRTKHYGNEEGLSEETLKQIYKESGNEPTVSYMGYQSTTEGSNFRQKIDEEVQSLKDFINKAEQDMDLDSNFIQDDNYLREIAAYFLDYEARHSEQIIQAPNSRTKKQNISSKESDHDFIILANSEEEKGIIIKDLTTGKLEKWAFNKKDYQKFIKVLSPPIVSDDFPPEIKHEIKTLYNTKFKDMIKKIGKGKDPKAYYFNEIRHQAIEIINKYLKKISKQTDPKLLGRGTRFFASPQTSVEENLTTNIPTEGSLKILLDPKSLERHFKPISKGFYKGAKFKLTNLFNKLQNKSKETDSEELANFQEDISHEESSTSTQSLLSDTANTDENDLMAPEPEILHAKKIKLRINTKVAKPKRHEMDNITENIVLGVIPQKHHLSEIIKKFNKLGQKDKRIHIVSVTDEFELGMPNMLTPLDYQQYNESSSKECFEHHQVPMTDFGADVTPEAILAAVYEMRKAIILKDELVYIHCKAGKARSAMILATYLAIFGKEDKLDIPQCDRKGSALQSAVNLLKTERPQVDLHDEKVINWQNLLNQTKGNVAKLQKAQTAINLHLTIKDQLKVFKASNVKEDETIDDYIKCLNNMAKNPDFKTGLTENTVINIVMKGKNNNMAWEFGNGKTSLSTLEFKNEIINWTSFKQLKIYIAGESEKSYRAQYINELLKSIYEATDDNWFENAFGDDKKPGPLNKLLNSNKVPQNVKDCIHEFVAQVNLYRREQKLIFPEELSGERIIYNKL